MAIGWYLPQLLSQRKVFDFQIDGELVGKFLGKKSMQSQNGNSEKMSKVKLVPLIKYSYRKTILNVK